MVSGVDNPQIAKWKVYEPDLWKSEGPLLYTEDNQMPPEARSYSYQAGWHLTKSDLPIKKGGRRTQSHLDSYWCTVLTMIPPTLTNTTTQSVPITASIVYCSPTIMASVMPITTLITTSMVLTFTMTLPSHYHSYRQPTIVNNPTAMVKNSCSHFTAAFMIPSALLGGHKSSYSLQ